MSWANFFPSMLVYFVEKLHSKKKRFKNEPFEVPGNCNCGGTLRFIFVNSHNMGAVMQSVIKISL